MAYDVDTEDHELELYADNTGELYPAKKAIAAVLKKKVTAGTYNHSAAARLWRGWFLTAAKRFRREIDQSANFPPSLLTKLADHRAKYERGRIDRGEWDHV
jgi:hypothetical protein